MSASSKAKLIWPVFSGAFSPANFSDGPGAGMVGSTLSAGGAAAPPAAPPALKVEPTIPAPGPSEKLAGEKAPEKTGQISFAFDDADIYAVIRTMADLLKINVIID